MKRLLILPLLLVTFMLSAAPIGEKRAREIATSFFASATTRTTTPALELEWAGEKMDGRSIAPLSATNQEEAMLYIYNRTDAQGFVVVAGDDGMESAIVAFSHDNNLQVENLSEGARYLLAGWCREIAAVRKSGAKPTRSSVGVGTVEQQYQTALWNQGTPFNDEAPVMDGYRAVTGCVATAMSILCYYHKWPERGVGTTPTYSYEDAYGTTRQVPANTLGRTYNYSAMRSDNYTSGYTISEGAAVAALMKDMGTSVQMMYHYSGSGAYDVNVPVALYTYFGYSKSSLLVYGDGYARYEWADALKKNIAQYGPTYFSGQSEEGGHAFVLDGYTSANYFHINYGWGGVDNGYYLLPGIEYAVGQTAMFYLEPDRNGTSTYKDSLSLIYFSWEGGEYNGLLSDTNEYKSGVPFNLDFGAIWNTGNVNFEGLLQVALCNEQGLIKETLDTFSISLESSYITAGQGTFTINSQIASGDRIRVLYKGQYSQDWQWMKRSGSLNVVDEIVVSLAAEDIAKSLGIKYNKESKQLSFRSLYNLTFEITSSVADFNMSGSVESGTPKVIDISSWNPGRYVVSFRRDDAVYNLTLIL